MEVSGSGGLCLLASQPPRVYFEQASKVSLICVYGVHSVNAHVIGVKKSAGFLHDFRAYRGGWEARIAWDAPEPLTSMCVLTCLQN